MSTLYIRLPSKATVDAASSDAALACSFAIASEGGTIEREGIGALSLLSDAVAKAQRVVLLLAASDVTLLQVKVPPLSAARLKAALPSLVEEQLMSDPADCILVAATGTEGMCTIGVVHRAWLEQIARTLIALGARNIAALPMQLCLPCQADSMSAAVTGSGLAVDVAIRLSPQQAIGLSMMSDHPQTVAQDVLHAIDALVPTAPIALYVPQAEVAAYQAVLDTTASHERIKLFADNWPRWIAGAKQQRLNLAAGLGAAAGTGLDWRPWRWPLALAAAVLLINVLGLNIDWLRMKRESGALRAGMIQTYKTAYPKETTIIDPILQMRQKIAAAQHDAGHAAPDDFIVLASAFGDVWQGAMAMGGDKAPSIAALDYNDRSLLVSLKNAGAVSPEQWRQIKTALAARNVAVTEQNPGKWQIRSVK